MHIGKINIPKIEIEPFAFNHDYQTKIYLQYANIVEKEEIGRLVVESLNQDSRVLTLIGKSISRGINAQIFEVKRLAMWFLWCANEYGQDKAKTYLEAFLNSDTISVINTLWVVGIEVESPIILDDGYIIRPLENMPDSTEKEYFLQNKMMPNFYSLPVPLCAITKDCLITKAWGNESTVKGTEYLEEYRKTCEQLKNIALILNSLNDVFCTPYFSTSYVNAEVPLGPFGGSGGGNVLYDVLTRGLTKLSSSEADNINELTKKYCELNDKDKKRMGRILDRLSQAKRRRQIDDGILDLGIALEMLLLKNSKKDQDQLSSSFRLRGSWLVGTDKTDRGKKYEQLKKIYGYRSDVAHNGILCDGNQEEITQVHKSFYEYLTLAENICQTVIKDGYPNWKIGAEKYMEIFLHSIF